VARFIFAARNAVKRVKPETSPDDALSGKPPNGGLFMDWFLDRAKQILHAMEYGQEYREAAQQLYQDTVRHVLEQIAQDALVHKPEIGTHHKRLCWLRPDLQGMYDLLEAEAISSFVAASKANETKD
jgi:hypothetical protein